MPLATVSEYNKYFGITSSDYNTATSYSLDFATNIISKYCDRDFEYKTHKEFINSASQVFLENYPVVRINSVNPIKELASIQSNAAAITSSISTFSKDSNNLTIFYIDENGEDVTEEYDLDNNRTLLELSTNVNSVSHTITINDVNYNDYSTKTLINVQGEDTLNSNSIYGAEPESIKVKLNPKTDRTLEIEGFGFGEILVNYVAGYIYPVDNITNTALTIVGNVPADLKLLCMQMASDFSNYFSKITNNYNNGEMKSESIGDYSYTRFDNDRMTEITSKYFYQLSKYSRFSI
jgi:hypothetical protein